MSTEQGRYIAAWNRHILVFAGEIGPRGSTTPQEQRAAEYAGQVMTQLGISPQVETFISATSGYQAHLLVALAMLVSFAVYPLAGRISALIATLLALVTMYSEIRELMFLDNLLRRLIATGSSQNVIGVVPPADEHRQDLILIGHLDTNHTGIIFSSPAWVDFWRIVSPTIFFSFCAQVVLYVVGAVTQWAWIWPVSIWCAICAVVLAAVCIQAELSPFSPGANDNASGAGLVLALAEHLTVSPLCHTRVWLVNTGCEEVKHYGAIDFLKRHRAEMVNPVVLVFEMLGRDGPAWVESEVIIPPFAYHADAGLTALAQRLAEEHPEWQAHPVHVRGGHTEMADPLRMGIPAITFFGIGPQGARFGYDGPPLYWHQKDDMPDRIDPAVLTRTYALVWTFITELDEAIAGPSPETAGDLHQQPTA